MIYTVQTKQDIATIKDELESKAKEIGFGVLNTYAFKKILADKGFPIEKDITVYELCNPPGAQNALSHLAEILFISLVVFLSMKRMGKQHLQP